MTPTTIIGILLLVFALAVLPERYKPTWIYRLNWWQVLIGLIATVAALLIVMNPEFLALGILGDSAFFDLLVFAIGIQLQVILSRIGVFVLAFGTRIVRASSRQIHRVVCAICLMVALAIYAVASTVERVVHRFIS